LQFRGFPADAFAWFRGLEADNTRAYFSASRATFEVDVRGALEAMLEQLADELGGHVRMFRQHRDVRFSADKSPYKTTTYGLIVERPDDESPLYAQISSGGLFAGSGYYQMAADQLARFRGAVVDDRSGPELERAAASAEMAGLEIFGAALKTAPRGFDRDHPRIALLRHKSLVAGARLAPGASGITRAKALRHTRQTWDACAGLNAWLAAQVGVSELPPEPRSARRRPR
jgi:uncharacterized protein (TIGR02453 family)